MLRVKLFRDATPLFDGRAAHVVLPGEGGEVSVFDSHAAMLCALRGGQIEIDEARFPVRSGVARVFHNTVTIVSH